MKNPKHEKNDRVACKSTVIKRLYGAKEKTSQSLFTIALVLAQRPLILALMMMKLMKLFYTNKLMLDKFQENQKTDYLHSNHKFKNYPLTDPKSLKHQAHS